MREPPPEREPDEERPGRADELRGVDLDVDGAFRCGAGALRAVEARLCGGLDFGRERLCGGLDSGRVPLVFFGVGLAREGAEERPVDFDAEGDSRVDRGLDILR